MRLSAAYLSVFFVVMLLGLSLMVESAQAGSGRGNGNAYGNGNGNGPKKTPGLALVVVAALSSVSYAGYQKLKRKKS